VGNLTPRDTRRLRAAGVLVVLGLGVFGAGVAFANVHAGNSRAFVRAGYCSVSGNTSETGAPLQPGTFLDLVVGAPSVDGHYAGAVPATFVEGVGLSCGTPPAGYVRDGFVDGGGHPGGIYPYYAKAS
jgi:hypothetical protein